MIMQSVHMSRKIGSSLLWSEKPGQALIGGGLANDNGHQPCQNTTRAGSTVLLKARRKLAEATGKKAEGDARNGCRSTAG